MSSRDSDGGMARTFNDDYCDRCMTATWCQYHGECLAESNPSSVRSPLITARERLAQMPGYINGYDATTEADQHHAYLVGFADAVREAESQLATAREEEQTPLDRKPRDIALLRKTLSMLCNFVWHREKRPGEHMWSIPVDKERDFDCIISDAIDELQELRDLRFELTAIRQEFERIGIQENGQIDGSVSRWQIQMLRMRAEAAESQITALREQAQIYIDQREMTLAAKRESDGQLTALRQEKIEMCLRAGRLLGPDFDGASIEDLAKEIIMLRALVPTGTGEKD